MNEIAYDETLSEDGYRVFWIDLNDCDKDELWYNSEYRAWDALGGDIESDYYEDLKPGRRRQFNLCVEQAQKIETMKAAFLSEQGRWLAVQGVKYDIEGTAWAPFAEPPQAKIMVHDDDTATLFKLTFGGNA